MPNQDYKLPTVILDFIAGHEAQESLHQLAEAIEGELKGVLQSNQVKPESSFDSIIVGKYDRDKKELPVLIKKSGGNKNIAVIHFQHNFTERVPDLGVAITLNHDETPEPRFRTNIELERFIDDFAPEIYQILSKAYGDVPSAFQAKKEKTRSP